MLGDSLKRRRGRPEPEPGAPRGPGPDWRVYARRVVSAWPWWLLGAAVIGVLGFGTGYLLATVVLFPRPETAGAGIPVPELYGETLERAEATLRTLELEPGEVREMTSVETEAGHVIAQDPLPGQQLLPGATVSLGVSAGPPELQVPPVVGLAQGTARELLETLGFDVAVQQTRSAQFDAGVVTRVDPEAGTSQPLPAAVTLVVSTGPPQDAIPDTPPAPGPGAGVRDGSAR